MAKYAKDLTKLSPQKKAIMQQLQMLNPNSRSAHIQEMHLKGEHIYSITVLIWIPYEVPPE